MGKVYFIVLDGAADWKIEELGEKTPLMVAKKPYLDILASGGQQSMIRILPDGYVPESDSGAMALLGYDPVKFYCGRGMLESLGVGSGPEYQYHVGFRINFATLDEKKRILDRRVARGLSDEELQYISLEIRKKVCLNKYPDVKFDLYTFGQFRGILSFYSNERQLSGNVSNTDPAYMKKGFFSIPIKEYTSEIIPCRPLDDSNASKITADIVNIFTKQCTEILKQSKVNRKRMQTNSIQANCILVRDGGSSRISMPKFKEKYGRSLSIYGQLPCEKALAELIGGQFFYTQAFDKQDNEEYLGELATIMYNDKSDVVFCHLKGPDEPGHDKKPFKKVEAIEKIDQYFFRGIYENLSEYDTIIVTCDHATPCELGLHSDDPVPLLLYGPTISKDEINSFDEISAHKGSCPVTMAAHIMDYIKEVC